MLFCQSQFYHTGKMDSTEENNNMALVAGQQENGLMDQSDDDSKPRHQTGYNKLYMEMLREIYAYCILEETVSGMHLAQGKPHHAYQMNV
jgi:hypothetical protein